jgi:hypothetical protein
VLGDGSIGFAVLDMLMSGMDGLDLARGSTTGSPGCPSSSRHR